MMQMQLFMILLFSWLPSGNATTEDATMLFVGDAMQHTPQIRSAQQCDGTYNYAPCFELLRPMIEAADFATANLECPLGGKPYMGYPRFSAPDEYAVALKDAGFDLLQTVNNHTLDCRDRGALRTLEVLDSIGIPHVGTYRIADDGAVNDEPFIADVRGYRVAFMAYTYGTNGIPVDGENLQVNYIDKGKMSADIAKAKHQGAQLICVMLHWGVEYMLIPNKAQKDLTDFLLGEGVDIIIGSHPHVVQPMEMRFNLSTGKYSLVIYSLGNFISNQNDTNSRGGAVAKVLIGRDYGRVVVKNANCDLFFVQKPVAACDAYRIIPSHREDLLRDRDRRQFDGFMTTAKRLFEKYNIDVPYVGGK